MSNHRVIRIDKPHTTEVLNVLGKDLGKPGIEKAVEKASKIIQLSVNPEYAPPPEPSDGLLYGLIDKVARQASLDLHRRNGGGQRFRLHCCPYYGQRPTL